MHVRFFNGNDPHAPADQPKEVLMIGLSPDQCAPPELHEAVRIASEADVATYGDAYALYEAEQKAKQEAEGKAGETVPPADQTLQPPDAEAVPPPQPPAAPPEPPRGPQPHPGQHDRRGR